MKIAFVGASGYGNVGDDTYPLVFREHLPGHELVFFNSDLPLEMPAGIGLLVLGGGGLIYNSRMDPPTAESPHFIAVKHYLKWARTNGVPWGFSSCGFQFSASAGQSPDNAVALEPWKPWLRDATFITVRSPVCKRLADNLGDRSDARFFPDAGYLLRAPAVHAPSERSNNSPKTLTIVSAGAINPLDPFVRHFISQYDAVRGWRIVWLNMGALVDEGATLADVRRDYPDHAIIERPTPHESIAHIATSRFVLTGRYHGMVFARSCDVPFFVPQDAPSKIKHEDFTVDPTLAIGHIDTLREVIARLTGAA